MRGAPSGEPTKRIVHGCEECRSTTSSVERSSASATDVEVGPVVAAVDDRDVERARDGGLGGPGRERLDRALDRCVVGHQGVELHEHVDEARDDVDDAGHLAGAETLAQVAGRGPAELGVVGVHVDEQPGVAVLVAGQPYAGVRGSHQAPGVGEGRDLDAGLLEGGADPFGGPHRRGVVAVHQQRVAGDLDPGAVAGEHGSVEHHGQRPLDQRVLVVHQRLGVATGHEGAVVLQVAVDEPEDDDPQTARSGLALELAGHGQHGQRRVELLDPVGHALRVVEVGRHERAEPSVRGDVDAPRCRQRARTPAVPPPGRSRRWRSPHARAPSRAGRSRRGRGSSGARRSRRRSPGTARPTRFMVLGSPAWKPQAMLAEVSVRRIRASSPIVHEPKLSPMSATRSTVLPMGQVCPPAAAPSTAAGRGSGPPRGDEQVLPLHRAVDGGSGRPARPAPRRGRRSARGRRRGSDRPRSSGRSWP